MLLKKVLANARCSLVFQIIFFFVSLNSNISACKDQEHGAPSSENNRCALSPISVMDDTEYD